MQYISLDICAYNQNQHIQQCLAEELKIFGMWKIERVITSLYNAVKGGLAAYSDDVGRIQWPVIHTDLPIPGLINKSDVLCQ